MASPRGGKGHSAGRTIRKPKGRTMLSLSAGES